MNCTEAAKQLFLSTEGVKYRIRTGKINVTTVRYPGRKGYRWDISEEEIQKIKEADTDANLSATPSIK